MKKGHGKCCPERIRFETPAVGLMANLPGAPCVRGVGIAVQISPLTLKIWRNDSYHYLGIIPVKVSGVLLRDSPAVFHLERSSEAEKPFPWFSFLVTGGFVITGISWITPRSFRFEGCTHIE